MNTKYLKAILILLISSTLSMRAGGTSLTINQEVTDSQGHVTRLSTTGSFFSIDFGRQNALGLFPVMNGQFLRTPQQNGAIFIADMIVKLVISSNGRLSGQLGPHTTSSFNNVYFVAGSGANDNRFNANLGIVLRRGEPNQLSTLSPGTTELPLSLAFSILDREVSLKRSEILTLILEEL